MSRPISRKPIGIPDLASAHALTAHPCPAWRRGLWAILLVPSIGTVHAADYHLGEGVTVGRFLLSGYVNMVAEAPSSAPAKLSIDDLSLFANGKFNRWVNPFFEAEITSLTLAEEGTRSYGRGYFVPERLYNDAHIDQANTLRIGKMLSPVGDWNSVHAAPLVPITTRPLTTYLGFSEYSSGLSWVHENPSGYGPDWQLYWQPGKEWYPRSGAIAPRRYKDVWGGYVYWPLDFADKVGLSFQQGQTTAAERYSLVGANGRKCLGSLCLEGETIVSKWSGGSGLRRHEWGLYGTADYAFSYRWHGLFSAEKYQDHTLGRPSEMTLLGLAYKPKPAAVWKLEYVHQGADSTHISSGWLLSFSALF